MSRTNIDTAVARQHCYITSRNIIGHRG